MCILQEEVVPRSTIWMLPIRFVIKLILNWILMNYWFDHLHNTTKTTTPSLVWFFKINNKSYNMHRRVVYTNFACIHIQWILMSGKREWFFLCLWNQLHWIVYYCIYTDRDKDKATMSSSAPLKQCIEMAFLTAIQGPGDGGFF